MRDQAMRFMYCWLFASLLVACKKKDMNAPLIIIEGENPLFIELGGTWVLPAYSASDIEDGDLTADVQIANAEINTGQIAAWEVVFSVSDQDGNKAFDTLFVNIGMGATAYTGDYSVNEIRDVDGDGILGEADVTDEVAAYTISISAGPEENALIIDNLGDYGKGVETIVYFNGELNEQLSLDTFIPDEDGIHLEGTGEVVTGTSESVIIQFDYDAEDGDITVPCEAEFIKL